MPLKITIRDLDYQMQCILSKFVGDSKLGGAGDTAGAWDMWLADVNLHFSMILGHIDQHRVKSFHFWLW